MSERHNPLWTQLLQWAAPEEWDDSVLGDMQEELQRREQRQAGWRTRIWIWAQAIEVAGQFALYRMRQRLLARRKEFQPVERRKGDGFMRGFLQDLRFGLRSLSKTPGFTLLAVMTLALGIGANSAIFTVVNTVLLRPLPVVEQDRLMYLRENNLKKGWNAFSVSPPNFVDWRAQSRSFSAMAALDGGAYNYAGGAVPDRLSGRQVTEGFFQMLGVRPGLGRLLEAGDYQPGKEHVVLLTHAGWQRLFGGDNAVVGREMMLNGIPYTVAGVLPADFRISTLSEIWLPRIFSAEEQGRRGSHFLNVMARLKPGVTVEQARQEMSAIASRLSEQYPDTNRDWGTVVTPFPELMLGGVRPALLVLMGAVGLVLLIACANVANMLLARASVRAREIAVRAAIGASRARLIRQLLTESLLLSGLGGGLGLLLAVWSTAVLSANLSGALPRAEELSVDHWVVAFTVGASVLAGLLFGLAPAWMVSRANLQETLKEGGGSGSAERRSWLRNTLVVAEIAIAAVLVAGAALLIQSFARLQGVPPGFRVDHGLTFFMSLPRAKYPESAQQTAFFQQALERMNSLPGVEAATLASGVPLSGDDELYSLKVEGRPIASEKLPSPLYYLVSPDYFRTMGIPLIAGRVFTQQDGDGAPRVAVINRAFAERIFPGENPVGQRIRLGRKESIVREIVGVVANTKHYGLGDADLLQVYEPFAQMPRGNSSFILRTSVEPSSLAEAVRREIKALDPEQPVVRIQTQENLLRDAVAPPRFRTVLLSLFSGLALLLASVGVYGVMSYVVVRRRQEIGIRMALGASRKDVIRMVVGKGLRLAGIGIVIGLAGAVAVTRLLQNMLFGIQATDAQTYVLTGVVLVAVALLACGLPALRASRVDAIVALRYE